MKEKIIPINLESLIDLSARLNETQDVSSILNLALLTLMGKLTISNGCTFYRDSDSNMFEMLINKGHCNIYNDITFDLVDFYRIEGKNEFEKFLLENNLLYLVPVIYQGNLNAVFALGKRLTDESIGQTERHYISLVSSITANSLEVTKERSRLLSIKNELEFRNLTLTTLFEITNDFSSFLSGEQILKLLSYRIMGQLMINKFAIYALNEKGDFEIVLNRCDSPIPGSYFDALMKLDKTETIESLKDSEIASLFEGNDLQVVSPMIVQGKIKGFLFIGKRLSGEKYTRENISFIESLGNIAISALENSRLFKEEVEKKQLENELSLALDIQKGFLPSDFPELENFEIAGTYLPSRHVAGDYFDFIKVDDDNLIIVIADVSGKGIAASLIMANIQAALKVLITTGMPHIEIVNQLNKVVFENTSAEKFVTFFIGFLNLRTNQLNYINAGHNPPFVFNKKIEPALLTKGGIPLGIFLGEYNFQEGIYNIQPGDMILLYTDGVTEAQNSKGVEFGEDKLIKFAKNNLDKSSDSFTNALVEEIRNHSNGTTQYDDITISVVKTKF